MLLNGRARDQIFVAERGFLSQAVEMTLGAIALDGSDGARVTRMLIANSRILDGEGVLVVAGRGVSRRVVGHDLNLPCRCDRALSVHTFKTGT
jgi:hypothetical protein